MSPTSSRPAGFPAADVHVMPYHTGSATTGDDDTAALIVRWRAAGTPKAKPMLLMGHMDVVEAKREDSTTDPFVMTEQRRLLLRPRHHRHEGRHHRHHPGDDQPCKAGFKPKRDIVVLFTGDEETNGIGARMGATDWLDLLGHPEFGLNADGGGGGFNPDKSPAGFTMQTAEKTFAGYTLTVRNRGGHSSKPRKDNAIYSLAHALDKIEAYRFTPMLNETTRAYFEGRQKLEKGPLGDAMRRWLANPERRRGRRLHRGERKRGRPDAHALRADAPVRRPCRQCAAAARDGDDQLPHLPRHRSQCGQGRA